MAIIEVENDVDKKLPVPLDPNSQQDNPEEPPPYTSTVITGPSDAPGPSIPRDQRIPPTEATASTSSASSIPALPHQNKVYIARENSAVKGVYVIDPSLPPPPPFPGTDNGSREKELSVSSKNGAVDAAVYLVGVKDKGRVELEAESKNGAVKISVLSRTPGMRVHISAVSYNGEIKVFLPPDFNGPLLITHQNGGVVLRPSLARVTRTFEERGSENRYWVGEWDGQSAPGETWTGDECVAWSQNGAVKVGFMEEVENTGQQEGGGFFSKLFKVVMS